MTPREEAAQIVGQAIWDRLKIGESLHENTDRILDRLLAATQEDGSPLILLAPEVAGWRRHESETVIPGWMWLDPGGHPDETAYDDWQPVYCCVPMTGEPERG